MVWKTPLPSRSNATPVVLGDRIFVTAEPNWLIAIRASDGQVLWQREVNVLDALAPEERAKAEALLLESAAVNAQIRALGDEIDRLLLASRKLGADGSLPQRIKARQSEVGELRKKEERAAPYLGAPAGSFIGDASSTPVTDGRSIYVVFGSNVAAAFSLEGERRWIRYLPPQDGFSPGPERNGIGGSPTFAADRLVVPWTGLYGIDPDTGSIVWAVPHDGAWTTPTRVTLGQTDVVVTASGRVVRALDGVVLAELPVAGRFASPMAFGRRVVFAGQPFVAMAPGENPPPSPNRSLVQTVELADDDSSPLGSNSLWNTPLKDDIYVTPVLANDHLFVLDEHDGLKVVEAASGRITHERSLAVGTGLPTVGPLVAGESLYVFTEHGDAVVLGLSEPYPELARNQLADGDTLHASPAFVGSRMYLRTFTTLYCIEDAGR
jgi:hypothetical protein